MKRFTLPILIILLTFSSLAGSSLYAQDLTDKQVKLATALKYLTSQQIISHIESSELAIALADISATDDLKTVSSIALEVTDKIISDKGNLQFILTDIEKLTSDKYSARLGNINTETITTAKNKLEQLADDMESRRPNFKNTQKPLKIDDFRLIMKQNQLFLTGENPEVMTSTAVWREIVSAIREAYPLWKKKHDSLIDKVNSLPDKKYEEILTREELLFAKTFTRVKLYYYMLSDE